MALQIWLPLTKQTARPENCGIATENKGTSSYSNTTFGTSEGKIGSSYKFNGSNSAIIIATGLTLNDKNWSYCCWAKLVNNSNAMCLYSQRVGVVDNQRTIFLTPSKGIFVDDGARYQGTLNTNATLTDWTHYCIVRNGNNITVYINGISAISWTATTFPASMGTISMFGASQDAATTISGNVLNGWMNDIRLYDHALSKREIKEISKGLVLHYLLKGFGANPNEINNGMPYTSTAGFSIAGTGWGAAILVDCDVSPSGKAIRSTYTGEGGNSGGIHHQPYNYSSLENGEIYTFSVWVRASKSVPMNIYNEMMTSKTPGMPITIGTEWTFVSVSGPINTSASYHSDIVYTTGSDVTTNMWIEVFGYKLEKGSKATPWIPHTTDTQYAVFTQGNNIEYDCSGYKYDASIVGTLECTSDAPRNSSAVIFANDKYIRRSSMPAVAGYANSYTFSWWGNYNSTASKMMWGYQNGNRLNLYLNSSKFFWNTGDGNNNPFGSISSDEYLNKWHHFAITGDGTTVKLYIDGQFKANATTYKAITGTDLIFNGWNTGNDYNFNGSLSDFRLYSTALSATDILELYNAPINFNKHSVMTQGEFVEQ